MAVALCATGTGGRAADKPADAKVAASPNEAKSTAASAAAKEKFRKSMSSRGDVKKLVDQLRTQTDLLIADHDAMVKALKDATEEQKKEIIKRIEDQKKAFEEVTSSLHKQIRDEQRKERAEAVKR